MFKEVLTPLSVMKPMVRFKMTARLPAVVFVDSPGSDISTITLDSMSTISPGTCFEEGMIVDESMAGNSQKSVFQKTLDAVIDVWRNSQWIHLPVPHVVRSMERVIDFATSRHVPPNFRCFDVSYQKQLGNDARNFLAMILVNVGYSSIQSNKMFRHTYERDPGCPHPLDWIAYYIWVHHFESKDPNSNLGSNRYHLYVSDQYLSMYMEDKLISPIRQDGQSIRMGITFC